MNILLKLHVYTYILFSVAFIQMNNCIMFQGIYEAVEYLLSTGFRLRRTLYIGFGHDEEVKHSNKNII